MAEAALGKQAEVLAHGDLARNGLEQILVVNSSASARAANSPDAGGTGNGAAAAKAPVILITRGAILQKKDDKWSEVLRCDEHLKNPNGYLGGSPAAMVTGWRLEYEINGKSGLELRFTPADATNTLPGNDRNNDEQAVDASDSARRTLVVRWNVGLKRYQSMDPSHERYLSEVPTLETPPSFLR